MLLTTSAFLAGGFFFPLTLLHPRVSIAPPFCLQNSSLRWHRLSALHWCLTVTPLDPRLRGICQFQSIRFTVSRRRCWTQSWGEVRARWQEMGSCQLVLAHHCLSPRRTPLIKWLAGWSSSHQLVKSLKSGSTSFPCPPLSSAKWRLHIEVPSHVFTKLNPTSAVKHPIPAPAYATEIFKMKIV